MIKVGVVGTGKMGENHVRTYLKLDQYCKFIGIYDNNEEKAKEISNKYGVQSFQNLQSLLSEVDAISIAVPTKYHYVISSVCVEYNVHMLLEKPITETIYQAEQLISKVKGTNLCLQIGHIELFNPLIQFLMMHLKNESVIGMEFHRMHPYSERTEQANVVKDLMMHDIYIVQEIFKNKCIEFESMGRMHNNNLTHAVAIASIPDDIIIQLSASFQSKKKVRSIHVFTENTFIQADLLANRLEITDSLSSKTISFKKQKSLQLQLQDFINSIKLQKSPTVTAINGLQTLKLADDISQQIKAFHACI